jgi:hypothetical protein
VGGGAPPSVADALDADKIVHPSGPKENAFTRTRGPRPSPRTPLGRACPRRA